MRSAQLSGNTCSEAQHADDGAGGSGSSNGAMPGLRRGRLFFCVWEPAPPHSPLAVPTLKSGRGAAYARGGGRRGDGAVAFEAEVVVREVEVEEGGVRPQLLRDVVPGALYAVLPQVELLQSEVLREHPGDRVPPAVPRVRVAVAYLVVPDVEGAEALVRAQGGGEVGNAPVAQHIVGELEARQRAARLMNGVAACPHHPCITLRRIAW
eukprot:gene10818-biopygen9840